MSQWVEGRHEMIDSHGRPAAAPGSDDPLRSAAYWLVAIAAFMTGLLVSQMAERARPASRVEWPAPAPTKPHPRSLGT
jgi:hypothetical protein